MQEKKKFKGLNKRTINWKLALVGLTLLLLASQVERLATQGTFLGYTVHKKQVSKPAEISKDSTNKPSEACDKAAASKVSDILGDEVERIGGSFADRKDPTFISVCTYRTKVAPARVVTIVLRDSKDEPAAKEVFSASAKKAGSTTVSDLGDEASFSSSSQQLTVRTGKRIATVTINKSQDEKKIASKDAAIKVTKLVL